MTDAEILSLAYQLRAAGDTRALSEIVAEVRADAEAMQPAPPAANTVVGESRIVLRDGTVKRFEHLGDGSKREV